MNQPVNLKCYICNLNVRIPLQCEQCKKLFCKECLEKKYIEEKKLFCPNCLYEQSFDNYQTKIELISIYSLNSLFYPNYDNNYFKYCIQCMVDFTETDENLHINHYTFPSKIIRNLKIDEAIKNLKNIIDFQNFIKSFSVDCRKDIKLIESIKQIKLNEIDIMKNQINKFYNKSKLDYEKLYKELEETNKKYEILIKDYLNKINSIINNNNKNEVRNINELVINEISKISKKKKKFNNAKQVIEQNIKFESFMENKMLNNQNYWNNEILNNRIDLNFINLRFDPKVSIYQNNNNEIIAKIELHQNFKEKNNFINVHLQINNSNDENSIKIPFNMARKKNDNTLIYKTKIENQELFYSLMENSPYFSIFISQLTLT